MAKFYFLAALAVAVSIVTLASFMKFQRYAFYNKDKKQVKDNVREVPFPMAFSMVILGIVCLALSLLAFPAIREAVLSPAVNIITNPSNYSVQLTGY